MRERRHGDQYLFHYLAIIQTQIGEVVGEADHPWNEHLAELDRAQTRREPARYYNEYPESQKGVGEDPNEAVEITFRSAGPEPSH